MDSANGVTTPKTVFLQVFSLTAIVFFSLGPAASESNCLDRLLLTSAGKGIASAFAETTGSKRDNSSKGKHHKTNTIQAQGFKYVEHQRVIIAGVLDGDRACNIVAYEAQKPYKQGDPFPFDKPPAKLCFVDENGDEIQHCFLALSENHSSAVKRRSVFRHQYVGRLSVVHPFANEPEKPAVLFSAFFSGGGSGILRFITLWVFDQESQTFVNILPKIRIALGEHSFLEEVERGELSVFVTAEAIWAKGETHFGCHRFQINMYSYDKRSGMFQEAGEFTTEKKYGSEEIDVIRHEIPRIRATLAGR